ncbi:pantoate--beta-alanine ligase [Nisaea acidiphila]|uniref:Pantothenate synthetase n=1 Tax=Nisaea acidiphila TaxID=1862145 RepID=A0A9J7AVM8_9PROT|nr:pantoate--beta-alanine ligase [Nisaea acidiphila]UUX51376.1 pantoate--beta-alanine ligase [Nisaea acidiphila]
MEIIRTKADLRARVSNWRSAGETIALTPTMGAIHEGHLSLVRLGLERANHCVGTIFVNPRQFGPNEDFATYPRDEEGDFAKFEAAGCDAVYAPAPDQIYGTDYKTEVIVHDISDLMEGASRPGFFTGVATVVSKLLIQAMPDIAIFGEKDFQQLAVIRTMARDLDLPIEILGAPTVREPDGLALSSRNAYLDESQRRIAPALHEAMIAAAATVQNGTAPEIAADQARKATLSAGFQEVDYIDIRDQDSFLTATAPGDNLRIFAAARLGTCRLIDNLGI